MASREGDKSSPAIFVVFSIVCGIFLILFARVLYKETKRSKMSCDKPDLTIANSCGTPSFAKALIKMSFPELRSTISGHEVNNIWQLHTWTRLVFRSEHRERLHSHLTNGHCVLFAFIHVLSAIFITGIIYSTSDPADSFCYDKRTKDDCLDPSTASTTWDHRCHWDDDDGCALRFVQDSFLSIAFNALIVCFCCTFVMMLFEYIFMYSFGSVKRRGNVDPVGTHAALHRRQSNTKDTFVDGVTTCFGEESLAIQARVQETFRELNQRLIAQRESLNVKVKDQFCAGWGIGISSFGEETPLPLVKRRIFSRKDLTVSELCSIAVYKDLTRAHQECHATLTSLNNMLCCIDRDADITSLESYFDTVVLQSLVLDLLPVAIAVLVKASWARHAPRPVFIENQMLQPLLHTAILAYVLGISAYILNFAARRIHALQLIFIMTVFLWFVIDALLVQPLTIFIQGYLIPYLTKASLYEAQDAIFRNLMLLDVVGEKFVANELQRVLPDVEDHDIGLLLFSSHHICIKPTPVPSRAADLVRKFSSSYPKFLLYADLDDEVDGITAEYFMSAIVSCLALMETLPTTMSGALLGIFVVGIFWVLLYLHVPLLIGVVSDQWWILSAAALGPFTIYVYFILLSSLNAKQNRDDLQPKKLNPVCDLEQGNADSIHGVQDETRHPSAVHSVDQKIVCNTDKDPKLHDTDSLAIEDVLDGDDNMSYSIRMSASQRTSRTSFILEYEDKDDSECDLEEPIFKKTVSFADLPVVMQNSEAEEDDGKSYSIITSRHSSRNSFSIDYVDDEESVEEEKSYTVDIIASHLSSRTSVSYDVDFEEEEIMMTRKAPIMKDSPIKKKLEINVCEEEAKFDTRHKVSLPGDSRVLEKRVLTESVVLVPIRHYSPSQTKQRKSLHVKKEVSIESSKVMGASYNQSLQISNENSVEFFDESTEAEKKNDGVAYEEGSVFSTIIGEGHAEGDSTLKPRRVRRLPAVAYLTPNRRPVKPPPEPVKIIKPFYEIYGLQSPDKRRKDDVLRKRLYARLRKEAALREQREKDEETLLPQESSGSPPKSPGSAYHAESHNIGTNNLHPPGWLSPANSPMNSPATTVRKGMKEKSDSVQKDEDMCNLTNVVAPNEENLEAQSRIRTVASPEKISFLKKLWLKRPLKSEKDRSVLKRVIKIPRISWRGFKDRFKKKNEKTTEVDSKLNKGNIHQTPKKKVHFPEDLVTPANGKVAVTNEQNNAKVNSEPTKKFNHGRLYRARVSWNSLKKRILKNKNQGRVTPLKQSPQTPKLFSKSDELPNYRESKKAPTEKGKDKESPRRWIPAGGAVNWLNFKERFFPQRRKGNSPNTSPRLAVPANNEQLDSFSLA